MKRSMTIGCLIALLSVLYEGALPTRADAAYSPCLNMPAAVSGAWFKGRGILHGTNQTGVLADIEAYNPWVVNLGDHKASSSAWVMMRNSAGDVDTHYGQIGWLKIPTSPSPTQTHSFIEVWNQTTMAYARLFYGTIAQNGGDDYHNYALLHPSGSGTWYLYIDGVFKNGVNHTNFAYDVDEIQAGAEVHNQPGTQSAYGDQLAGDNDECVGLRNISHIVNSTWTTEDLGEGLAPTKPWFSRNTYTDAYGRRSKMDVHDIRCPN